MSLTKGSLSLIADFKTVYFSYFRIGFSKYLDFTIGLISDAAEAEDKISAIANILPTFIFLLIN